MPVGFSPALKLFPNHVAMHPLGNRTPLPARGRYGTMGARSYAVSAEHSAMGQEHREMATPLLTTKLYIPPVRREWVPRPRLLARLNDGLDHKLTLISTPAGFGKTTLLSGWTRQSAFPVAWVSLDEGDNDPARFWAYVIAAVKKIHKGIGDSALAALQSPQLPQMEGLLNGLLNEIAQVSDPTVLVLDDFHVIADGAIHEGLTFLLDNVPPQMHLILSSRADPPWPLARLRARREMIELRTIDLRFTDDEAASFLNEAMKLDLSPGDIAALEERTEGWIVGLQMASLAMQAQLSTRGRREVSGFIKAFSGSHRFILDYLVEEVLDQQSPDVQEFLLKTSILERMTAPLCDAVTASDDSQTILAQLDQANLFVVPLDDERCWYRYHQLFADLLRSRLQQTQPDGIPALHRRASEWHESSGQIVEAVGHALLAGDVEWIERLIAGNALAVIYHGELATVARWLDALPEEVMRSRPRLGVAQAWVLAYAGQIDGIEALLGDAERALVGPGEHTEAPRLSPAEGRQIAGHIAAIRAYVAALRDDWSRATELAREALDLLPEEDLTVRGWTAALLGDVLRSQADFAAAAQAFAEAIALSRAAGNSYLEVDVLWEQALLHLAQGQLRNAMGTCEEALQVADQSTRQGGRQLPVTGYIYTLMSEVLCEWNDLETALRYGQEGLELCQRWGQADALTHGYYRLARVLHAAGKTDDALHAVQEARRMARGLGASYVITAGAHEARIRLAQGDVTAAARWVQESGLGVDDELRLETCIGHLALAKILLAQGRLDEALVLLVRLLRMVEAAGAMTPAIGILVLQALVLQAQGEGEQALVALERALTLAEPEGYVRVFIGEGAPMGKLLRQAAARGIKLDYVAKLLATLEGETDRQGITELIEPLTNREMEVLRLLATPLSTSEIAQELYVSVHTARSHIKSIYRKLEVHKRMEAIQRAKELELL
jgi:LuxR family maltose regulon positive regulatory protein